MWWLILLTIGDIHVLQADTRKLMGDLLLFSVHNERQALKKGWKYHFATNRSGLTNVAPVWFNPLNPI